MSLSHIPQTLRDKIFERDAAMCQYCGLAQVGQGALFHIDHIMPKSRGGPTNETNLALQCPWCSLHKANKIEGLDQVTKSMVALFHPRNQKWQEHFVLASDGSCHGISPTGRATVEALGMNDELPKLARSMQLHLKIIKLPS